MRHSKVNIYKSKKYWIVDDSEYKQYFETKKDAESYLGLLLKFTDDYKKLYPI